MKKCIIVLFMSVFAVACQPSDSSKADSEDQDKHYTKIADDRITIAEGAKVEELLNEAGALQELKITAADNSAKYTICQCHGACAAIPSNPCKINVDHTQTGSSTAWCTGSCSNSEGNACGCVFGESDTPQSDASFGNAGVDPGDEPPVDEPGVTGPTDEEPPADPGEPPVDEPGVTGPTDEEPPADPDPGS